jgi:hypothetical protein
MADSSSEGGTKINRTKNVQQMDPRAQQQMDPRAQQQMDPRAQQQMQQQMDPRAQQQMQQQMDPRAQQQMQQQMQQQQMQQMDPMVVESINKNRMKSMKNMFGNGPLNTSVLKTSVLVSLIFVLLNSKMVWKQLIKLPMMGTVDPSILALIVNAILAGIIFYCINITLK